MTKKKSQELTKSPKILSLAMYQEVKSKTKTIFLNTSNKQLDSKIKTTIQLSSPQKEIIRYEYNKHL